MKTFGDVIEAFERADIDQRNAFWRYGGDLENDGNLPFVLVVDDQFFEVTGVVKMPDRIVVTLGHMTANTAATA